MTKDAEPSDEEAPRDESAPDAVEVAPVEAAGSADHAALRRRPLSLVLVFAVGLAFFAASAAGFLWWQYRQFYVALDRADGATDVALRDVRAELRALEDRLEASGADRAELVALLEQVVDRVNGYPARFADLEEKLAAAQGVSVEARSRWLRAQAEYFLRVAITELTLRGNRGNAIAALELADRSLLDAGNPAFGPVRQRIAGELLALRGMAVADIEGLSFSLGQLGTRVAELPMRSPAPSRDAATPDVSDAQPGLGRLWASVKNALGGMFRIERLDTSSVYSLTRDQQRLVRRQLELELALARSGLVGAMPEVYRASIATATELFETHFERSDPGVDGALALLGELAELDVAPEYPDISGSLALLRNLSDRDG